MCTFCIPQTGCVTPQHYVHPLKGQMAVVGSVVEKQKLVVGSVWIIDAYKSINVVRFTLHLFGQKNPKNSWYSEGKVCVNSLCDFASTV